MLMSLIAGATIIQPPMPVLSFQNKETQALLGECYVHALDNIFRINAIKARNEQNRTGLIHSNPGTFLRAGGDYQDPWTRDASINCWNAASLIQPALAENTLWAVCEKRSDGSIHVQDDNQWWDKIIWVIAAWNHYCTTGDRAFLKQAYSASKFLANEQVEKRFDKEFGLFQGPSHLQDGIAGYPEPFDDAPGTSSFVLDHPGSDKLITLSVNCLYMQALKCLASMAKEIKEPSSDWTSRANALRKAINNHFWIPEQSSYAYLLYGAGELRGKQAKFQESTGISFALMFGVPDAKRARAVLNHIRTTPFGIPLVDPEFKRYSTERPGRHSRIVWPLAQGYWSTAVCAAGSVPLFQKETETLAKLVKGTDWNFYEIYSPIDGRPDGGWQNGSHWGSCTNQTWSASSYVRMIHYGLFGMSFEPSGVRFRPNLPKAWGAVSLKGVRYRSAVLDIKLKGSGRRIASFEIDGFISEKAFVPANLKGEHSVEIVMR